MTTCDAYFVVTMRVLEVPSTIDVGDAVMETAGAIEPPENRPVHPVRTNETKKAGSRSKREGKRTRQELAQIKETLL
jgi:hypothetical protein